MDHSYIKGYYNTWFKKQDTIGKKQGNYVLSEKRY